MQTSVQTPQKSRTSHHRLKAVASLLAVALVVSGGALFTQRFVANQAEAADSANVNWLVTDQRFDCNSFYTTGNSADAGGNYGVFRWPVNADGTLGTGVNVYKGSGTGGGWRSDQIATMAIGPDFVTDSNSPWYSSWSYGAQEKKIVAYHWSWGSGGTSTNPDKRDWIPVQKVTPGENKTREVLVPNPTVATGRSAGSNWSGGEVNQLTGEIYFTGSNSDAVRNDGQGTAALMRYNPVTEQYIAPSRLVPASEHDKLSREKDGKGALAPGDYSFTVSSDVAVDADGNFYIVVHSEYWGTRVRYLLKVTAGAHQTDWKWNKIGVLTGDVPDGAWWGMGFVNGTLYVGGTGAGRERIYRVDTMSGQVSRLNSSNAPWSIYDGAACQVAPLVTGKVYNDVNGNGQIDPGEDALPGQTVEIYDKNGVLRGTELTDGEGSYDFLVNSAGKTDSDFYVRVARPQIDGVNSAQTYASAGDDNGNITTAYCWDHGQDYYESHVSGICRGAREDQRDRLAESTVGTANSPVGANGAMIVSKIHFGNDKSVAHADFGITNAASYGDAAYDTEVFPSGPGTSYQGPSHIRGSVHGPLLYLGSKAEANQPVVGSSVGVGGADLHGVSDDGVDLEVSPGVFVSLQDQVLAVGNSYRLRVHAAGSALVDRPGDVVVSVFGGDLGSGGVTPAHFPSGGLVCDSHGDVNGDFFCVLDVPSSPLPSGGVRASWVRARVGLSGGLLATDTGVFPVGRGVSSVKPWWVAGEVEDYRVQVATGTVSVTASSVGGFGSFPASFGAGVSSSAPSSVDASVVTTSAGVFRSDAKAHVFSSPGSTDLVLTTNPPTGWKLISASLTKHDGSKVDLPITNGKVTIPKAETATGHRLGLALVYGRGVCVQPDRFGFVLGDVSGVVADGVGVQSAVFELKGCDDAPVEGVSVSLVSVDRPVGVAGSVLSLSGGGVCVTDRLGRCSVDVSSTAAGEFSFRAELVDVDGSVVVAGGVGSPRVLVTHWVAGSCDVSLSFSPGVDQLVSGSSLPFTGVVRLRDGFGNRCVGKAGDIGLSVSPADGVRLGVVQETAVGSGDYSFGVGSSRVGVKSVTVVFDGVSRSGSVGFVSNGPASSVDSVLTVDKGSVVVGQSVSAGVTVRDQWGNLLSGVPVHVWTSPSDLVPVGLSNLSTDSAGRVVVPFSTSVAGVYEVHAEVVTGVGPEEVDGSPVSVVFTPDVDPLQVRAGLDLVPSSGVVAPDGVSFYTATVSLTDQFGNALPNFKVRFDLQGVGGVVGSTPVEGVTSAQGLYSVRVVSNGVEGSGVVRALWGTVVDGSAGRWVRVDPLDGGSAIKQLGLEFRAGVVESVVFERVSSGVKVADDSDYHLFVVRVYGVGHVLKGGLSASVAAGLSFTAVPFDVDPLGVGVGVPVVTETSQGVYEVRVFSRRAGTKVFAVAVDGVTGVVVSGGSDRFVFGAGVVASGVVSVPVKSGVTANGSDYHTVEVVLTDRFGNGVPGQVVDVEAVKPGSTPVSAVVSGVVEVDAVGDPGVYRVGGVTATAWGDYVVTGRVVSANNLVLVSGGNVVAHFDPWLSVCTSPVNSGFTVSPASLVVGGTAAATVSLRNCNGDVLPDVPVSFSVDNEPGWVVAGGKTGASGVFVGDVSTVKAGLYQVRAFVTIGGVLSELPAGLSPQVVRFTPGAGAVFSLEAVSSGDRLANPGVDSFYHEALVRVADVSGNPVGGYPVRFGLNGGVVLSGYQAGGVVSTGSDGVARLRFKSDSYASHEAVVSAQREDGVSGVWQPVLVSGSGAGDLRFSFVAAGVTDVGFQVSSGDRKADGVDKHTVTVTVQGAGGVPVSGVGSLIGASAGDAVVGLPFVETSTPGVYSADVVSTSAGVKTVVVSYPGVSVAPVVVGQNGLSFVYDESTIELVSVVSDPVGAQAVTGQFRVVAVVQDASGNPAVGELGKLSALVTGGVGVSLSSPTHDAAHPGSYYWVVSTSLSGAKTVQVSLDRSSLAAPFDTVQRKSVTVLFNAGQAVSAELVLSPSGSVDAGSSVSASVRVFDQAGLAGSLVPGVRVSLDVRDSQGGVVQLVGGGVLSDEVTGTGVDEGVARFVFATNVAGVYTVTASVQGVSDWVGNPGSLRVDSVCTASSGGFTASLSSSTVGVSKLPDGVAWHEASVTVRDTFGNVCTNSSGQVAVSFAASPAASVASGYQLSGTTSNGVFTTRFVSSVPVSYDVTAVAGGSAVLSAGSTAHLVLPFAFTGGPDLAWYSVSPAGSLVADGVAAFTVLAHLESPVGTAMTGQAGLLGLRAVDQAKPSDSLFDGVVSGFTATGTPGEYTATVVADRAGVKDLTVSWGSGSSMVDVAAQGPAYRSSVEFVSGPPVSQGFWVSRGDKEADGVQYHNVFVELFDASGNPVTNLVPSRLTASSDTAGVAGLATVGGFSKDPGVAGVYVARVTSGNAGAHNISVLLDGNPVGLSSVGADRGNRVASFISTVAAWAGLSVSPSGSQTVGSGGFVVSVTVRSGANGAGNAVQGVPVTLTLPSSGVVNPYFDTVSGPLSQVTLTTGVLGVVSVTVRSDVSGSFPVSASVQGLTVEDSPASVVFEAGLVNVSSSSLRFLNDDSGARVADGTAYFTVVATLLDDFGNPAVGREVDFSVGVPGQVVASSWLPTDHKTNSQGQVSVRVVGNNSGSALITASAFTGSGMQALVTAAGAAQQLQARFIPGGVSQTNSFFVLPTENSQPVVNTTAHQVVVYLRDGNGVAYDLCKAADQVTPVTPCRFDEISATALGDGQQGDAVVGVFRKANASEVITGEYKGGEYIADITSTKAGGKTVAPVFGFTLGSKTVGHDRVTFLPDEVDPSKSVYTVSSTAGRVANGVDTQTVTVSLLDQFGNQITGQENELSASASPASVVLPFVATSPGVYTATVVSVVAGSHSVTVQHSAAGTSRNLSGSGNTLAVFVAGAADPAKSSLTVDRVSQTVGGPVVATVTLRDAHGNLVPGQAVTVHTTPDTNPSMGYVSGVSGSSGAGKGVASFTLTSLDAVSYQVYATVAVAANTVGVQNSPVSVGFVADSPDTAVLSRTSSASELPAGASATAHSVLVSVQDQYGNPVAGAQVVFSLTGNGAAAYFVPSGSSATVVTDAAGQATALVRAAQVGVASVEARVGVGLVTTPASVQLKWVNTPNPDPARSWFDLSAGDRVAGDNANPHSVTVSLVDAYGADMVNMENLIAVSFTQTGVSNPQTVVGGFSYIGNGQYQASVTSALLGVKNATVMVGTTVLNVKSGGAGSVSFVAGTVDLLKSSYQVTDDERVADGQASHTVTVDLRDGYNNPVAGGQGVLTAVAAPSVPQLALGGFTPSSTVPGRYVALVSSTKAGLYQIRVTTSSGDVSDNGNNTVARFIADAPSASKSKLEAVTTGQKNAKAENHTVKTTVLDANGNPIRLATVTLSTQPAISQLPNGGIVTTDANGEAVFSFTATLAGLYTMFADVRVGNGAVVHPVGHGVVVVEFVNAPVDPAKSSFEVSQRVDQVADDDPSHYQTATVFLADQNGVPVAGQAASLAGFFDPAGPHIVLQNGAQFVEDSNRVGYYTAVIRSLKAGSNYALRVRSGATSLVKGNGLNDLAVFVAGPGDETKSVLTVSASTVQVGQTIVATVEVRDQYDNPALGQVVRLVASPDSLTGGNSLTKRVTNPDGKVSFDLTTQRKGQYVIEVGLLQDNGNVLNVTGSPVTLEWTQGTVALSNVKTVLTGTSGDRLADNSAYHEAKVVLYDQYDNPVSGQTVTFELTGVGVLANGYGPGFTTDANGEAVVRYVSNFTLGTAVLKAKTNGNYIPDHTPANQPAQLDWNWITTPVDLTNSWYTVPTAGQTKQADGLETHQVEIVLQGANGKGVVGEENQLTVTWLVAGNSPVKPVTANDPQISPVTAVAGKPGYYQATITSTWAASFDITVLYANTNVDVLSTQPNKTVQFVAGPVDQTQTSYIVSTGSKKADGNQYHTAVLKLLDTYGNGIPAASVTVQAVSNDSKLSRTQAVYNPNSGEYVIELRTTSAGDYGLNMFYTLPGGSVTQAGTVSGGNTLAQFVADSPDQANTTFDVVPRDNTASVPLLVGTGMSDGYDLVVNVRDAKGNPVADVSVVFQISPSEQPGMSSNQKTVKTGPAGRVVVPLVSTLAVTYTINALIWNNQYSKTATASFRADTPDSVNTVLTGTDSQTRYADNSSFHTATVSVKDRYGNPVVGQLVSFTVADVGAEDTANAQPNDHRTDIHGEVTIQVKSNQVLGTARVSATVDGMGVVLVPPPAVGTQYVLLRFVAKMTNATAYQQVSTGDKTVGDSSDPHRVWVSVFDGAGAPLTVNAAELSASVTPAAGVTVSGFSQDTSDPSVTNRYVATVNSTTDGVKTVTAKWNGNDTVIPSGQTSQVSFIADNPAVWYFTVTGGEQPADGNATHQATVHITDVYGNGINGYANRLTGAVVDATISAFTNTGKGVYTADITSLVRGSHIVSVSRDTNILVPVASGGNNLARFVSLNASDQSFLTVTTGSKPVGDTHTATVTVLDQNHNPVEGQTVRFYTDPVIQSPAAVACAATSNSNGVVACDFTAHQAGTYTVYAQLVGAGVTVQGSGSKTVTFNANTPNSSQSVLDGTVSVAKAVNNNTDPHLAWVEVRDQYGNPVSQSNVTVSFTLTGLTGVTANPAGPVSLDANGRAQIVITSPTQGVVRVSAVINTPTGIVPVGAPTSYLDLLFETSDIDPSRSSWQVTNTTPMPVANNVDFETITVQLRDNHGARVHGKQTMIAITFNGQSLTQPAVSNWVEGTDPATSYGDYTARITSTITGQYTISVNANGLVNPTPTSPTQVSYQAGMVNPANSSYEVTPNTRQADGQDPHTITVRLTDNNNNPVPGQANNLTATATPAQTNSFTETTTPGTYTADVVSTIAGNHQVTVRYTPLNTGLPNGVNNNTAVFIPGLPDPAKSTLTRTSTNPQRVATGSHTYRAVLRDNQNNPIPNQTITLQTDPSITIDGGNQKQTDNQGQTVFTLKGNTEGTYLVYAQVVQNNQTYQLAGSGTTTQQAVYEYGPIDPTNSWFTVSQTTGVIADGNPANHQLLTVRLADSANQGITNRENTINGHVTWNPSSGPAVTTFTADPTNPGTYTAQITSTRKGDFIITVTSDQQNVIRLIPVKTGDNQTATFVAGTATASSTLTATPLELPVQQTSTATVKVTDAHNNTVPNQPVQFWTTPPGLINIPGAHATIFSDQNGNATLPLTTTQAGQYVIHAALEGISTNPIPVTNSGQITITFKALTTPDWNNTHLTGTTNTRPIADGQQTHQAQTQVTDQHGNPIPNKPVTFTNTGVGTWVNNPTCTNQTCTINTNNQGIALTEITSTTAGNALISAQIDGHDITNGQTTPTVLTLPFNPGPADPTKSSFTVTTGNKLANNTDTHTITITLKDTHNNGVPGQENQLNAQTNQPNGVTISPFQPTTTPGTYQATIRSTTAGTKTITTTHQTTPLTVNQPGRNQATFIPDQVDPTNHSYYTVTNTPTVIADGQQHQTITIYLADNNNNPVPGQATHLTSQATALTSNTHANITNITETTTPGVYTALVTATIATQYLVTITYHDTQNNQTPLTTTDNQTTPPTIHNNQATFIPGPVDPTKSTLTVSPGDVTVGNNHWAEANLRDANNNPVTNQTIEFWTNNPNNHNPINIANGGHATTNTAGTAHVTLTTRQADLYTVYAKLVTTNQEILFSGQRTIRFIAGTINGQNSTLNIPTENTTPAKQANGTDTHTIQITLRDTDNNPVANTPANAINITVTDPTGQTQIHQPTNPSNNNGITTIQLSARKAGIYTITATVTVAGIPQTITPDPVDPAIATFTPGDPSPATSQITATPHKVVTQPAALIDANAGKDQAIITITLKDNQNNPLGPLGTGQTINLQTTYGTTTPPHDNQDGTYTSIWTADKPGTYTARFTINGQPSTQTTTVKFIAKPNQPTPRFANSTTTAGTAQPNTTVTITDHTGTIICQTITDYTGNFRCEPNQPPANHADQLTITLTEPDGGFHSDPTTTTVTAIKPNPPTVNPSNPETVTGTTTPDNAGNQITIKDDTGTTICETTVQPDGTFTCKPLQPKPADGTHITVTITDPAENQSNPTEIIIDARPPKPPTVEPTTGDIITGTSDKPGTITIVDNQNKPICQTTIQPDGTWSCTPNRPINDNEKLHITSTDPAGNHSGETTITVDQSTLPPPTINTTNGDTITGHANPGSTITITFPNGTQTTTTTDRDGNWQTTPPPNYNPQNGDKITATQTQPFNTTTNKTSPPAEQTIDRTPPPPPQPKPTDGTNITGTGEPGAHITIRDTNNKTIGETTVQPDGTWTTQLNPTPKQGDLITITQTDPANNTSQPTTWRIGLITITIEKRQLYPGEQQTATITNLQPGETVQATMHSQPQNLGQTTANTNGQATYTWTITQTTPTGTHHITATAPQSGTTQSQPFVITNPNEPTPLSTTVLPGHTIVVSPTTVVVPPQAGAVVPKGSMPKTGGESLVPVLGGALGALLVGLALIVVATRRRRKAHQQSTTGI